MIKLTLAVLLATLNPCKAFDYFNQLQEQKAADAEARGQAARMSGGYYNPQSSYPSPQGGYYAPQQGGYSAPQYAPQGGYYAPPQQSGYYAPQQGYSAPQQGGYSFPQGYQPVTPSAPAYNQEEIFRAVQPFKAELMGEAGDKPYQYLSSALRLLATQGEKDPKIIKGVAESGEIIHFYKRLNLFPGSNVHSELQNIQNQFPYLRNNRDFQAFATQLIF